MKLQLQNDEGELSLMCFGVKREMGQEALIRLCMSRRETILEMSDACLQTQTDNQRFNQETTQFSKYLLIY